MDKPTDEGQVQSSTSSSTTDVAKPNANAVDLVCENQISEGKAEMTANEFVAQNMFEQIRVQVDTVKCARNVRSMIALSSGESDWYGVVRGCAARLELQSVLCDCGMLVSLEKLSDSSAARGLTSRQGLGRAGNIQTQT